MAEAAGKSGELMQIVQKQIGSGSDSSAAYYLNPDDCTTGTAINVTGYARGYAIYDQQPVEIKIELPKKKPIPELVQAKSKEQLKAWGLRK